MTVRPATIDDLSALIELGKRFHAMSNWAHVPFSEDRLTETLIRFFDTPSVAIFITEDLTAMIGVCLAPVFFADVMGAQEMFWYSEKPGHGSALMTAAEVWAEEMGAGSLTIARLSGLNDEMMHRMYTRRGYGPTEVFYNKGFETCQ